MRTDSSTHTSVHIHARGAQRLSTPRLTLQRRHQLQRSNIGRELDRLLLDGEDESHIRTKLCTPQACHATLVKTLLLPADGTEAATGPRVEVRESGCIN